MNTFNRVIWNLRKEGMTAEEILDLLMAFAERRIDDYPGEKDAFSTARVKVTLEEMGMPIYMEGYSYWVYAITNFWKKEERIMKVIYETIGKEYKISAPIVKRRMQMAIEKMYAAENADKLVNYFGKKTRFYDDDGTIKNKEFLNMMVEYLAP